MGKIIRNDMVGQPDIIDLNRPTGYPCRDVLRIPYSVELLPGRQS